MNEEIQALRDENERLKSENELLLRQLCECRDDVCRQTELARAVKKELRRCEVQLSSMKTENDELKNKFAKITGNPIGALLIRLYRFLREIKRRRG